MSMIVGPACESLTPFLMRTERARLRQANNVSEDLATSRQAPLGQGAFARSWKSLVRVEERWGFR